MFLGGVKRSYCFWCWHVNILVFSRTSETSRGVRGANHGPGLVNDWTRWNEAATMATWLGGNDGRIPEQHLNVLYLGLKATGFSKGPEGWIMQHKSFVHGPPGRFVLFHTADSKSTVGYTTIF
jgi:hypothetical protein